MTLQLLIILVTMVGHSLTPCLRIWRFFSFP